MTHFQIAGRASGTILRVLRATGMVASNGVHCTMVRTISDRVTTLNIFFSKTRGIITRRRTILPTLKNHTITSIAFIISARNYGFSGLQTGRRVDRARATARRTTIARRFTRLLEHNIDNCIGVFQLFTGWRITRTTTGRPNFMSHFIRPMRCLRNVFASVFTKGDVLLAQSRHRL